MDLDKRLNDANMVNSNGAAARVFGNCRIDASV